MSAITITEAGALIPFEFLSPTAQRRAWIIEDVKWLASWEVPFEEIAKRVGKSPTALQRSLYRWGLPELARLGNVGSQRQGGQ